MTALQAGRLGLGTAPLAGLFRPRDETDARAAIDCASSLGIRHFDTAPLYGSGLAELRLGEALRDRPRDQCTIRRKSGGSSGLVRPIRAFREPCPSVPSSTSAAKGCAARWRRASSGSRWSMSTSSSCTIPTTILIGHLAQSEHSPTWQQDSESEPTG